MRSDLLRVLQDSSIADEKKGCIVMYAIIPLVSATFHHPTSITARCHNPSIDLETAIPTSFLESYITQYLQSLQPHASAVHKDLLIALLQLNALLIKHLSSRISPYRKVFNAFAIHLYTFAYDDVVAWSLYFQCQFLVAYQYNGVQIIKLFINIIHLYSNRSRDVIYHAASLLSARSASCLASFIAMLRLDSKNKLVLFARVRQNMLMNEHIIEQQIHIWRLIVQNPEFFFPFRVKFIFHILREMRHLGIRSTDAYANRELSVDMLCLITSFDIRDEKEQSASACVSSSASVSSASSASSASENGSSTASEKDALNGVDYGSTTNSSMLFPSVEKEGGVAEAADIKTLRLLAYTQVMNTLCRTMLISCVNPAEQRICSRGFNLMKVLLTRIPRLTLRLDDVDHFTHFYDQLLINYPEGSPSRHLHLL